jgi:hypothetical protein
MVGMTIVYVCEVCLVFCVCVGDSTQSKRICEHTQFLKIQGVMYSI